MIKLNNICETYLPWFVNNFLRWLTQLVFLPLLFWLCFWDTIKQPFLLDFRNGGTTLDWGWEILKDDDV